MDRSSQSMEEAYQILEKQAWATGATRKAIFKGISSCYRNEFHGTLCMHPRLLPALELPDENKGVERKGQEVLLRTEYNT
jgi:hypothetical protein